MKNIVLDILFSDNLDTISLIDSERAYTKRQILFNAFQFSQKLEESSKNIVIQGGNTVYFVIAVISAWLANKIPILIHKEMKVEDVLEFVKFCECNTFIIDREIHLCSKNIKEFNISAIESNNQINSEIFYTLLNEYKHKHLKHESLTFCKDDTLFIIPSSGTTNKPKFIKITYNNIISEIEMLNRYFGLNENTRELIILPITCITGFVGQFIGVLAAGGSIVLYDKPIRPKALIRYINDNNVNYLVMTPTLIKCLLNGYRLGPIYSVKKVVLCGEMVDNSLRNLILEYLPNAKVYISYGMAEVSSAMTIAELNYELSQGAVGQIFECFSVRIVDNNGVDCDEGVEGEIIVKGQPVMEGYYKNKKLTEDSFRDGYYKTGDIGFVEHNILYITGRKNNMIIVNGRNVFAEEVEYKISKHPLISDVLVYGIPDLYTGEAIVADIVLKDKEAINKTDINNYCCDNLDIFKIPKYINFVDEIYVNPVYKITRNG